MPNTSHEEIRYDEVLPTLVNLIISELGQEALSDNLIFRDADGIVTFVLREDIEKSVKERLSSAIKETLKKYSPEQPIATPSELFDPTLNNKTLDNWELITLKNSTRKIYIRYIEKRIIGNDWIRGICKPLEGVPPIVVFSSHKGGVGRSTALSIAATELSREGKKVLAIDLDLEAPGIGGMFHRCENLPLFGTIDYYVEFGRSDINDQFLNNMCTAITDMPSGGSITVIAAAGKACTEHPENVIGKISRAYLESINDINGETYSFLDKTRQMLTDLCRINTYDVIFIDARAGLNESTAATIQGLGADILFFGVDTPQTWEGYNYFLSHLSRFKSETSLESDWRYKIKMVHAKAADNQSALAKYRDKSFDLFASYLYDELEGNETAEGLPDAFSFDLDDPTAPHYAWPIYISPDFYEFNPIENNAQLNSDLINPAFGDFIMKLKDRLGL
ncbi:MAG: MinD-like ATPase involved in chromosome partitioning or flagellar assembly [Pseudomonas sp.]|jgi:MinD-like ATPase involved in chromosome partitioning or flagellar assembly